MHRPTEALREQVRKFASCGTNQEDIGKALGIAANTLAKYYRKELDEAEVNANGAVAGALYDLAIKGNVTAQIFWLKTRARWREVTVLANDADNPITPVINVSIASAANGHAKG